MYYDDPYDPNLENDYDDAGDNVSVSEMSKLSSVHSLKKYDQKNKKLFDEFKTTDRNYHSVKRDVNGKVVSVELYDTSITPGTRIRDATSGATHLNLKLGSSDEDLFFKVKIATGEKGFGQEAHTFFFESPEVYERYTGATVSQETKEKWLKKNIDAKYNTYEKTKKRKVATHEISSESELVA